MTRPALPRWLWPVLRLCGTAIILATILRRVEVTGAWEAMRGAPSWVWALPFSMLMCVSAIHALRLRILLGGIGVSCRWATAMGAILRGQFVGLVLPRGGGDLARLAWLSRHTGRSDAVVAVGVGARILEICPWMLLLFYGLGWGLLDWSRPIGLCALGVGLTFACVLAVAALIVRWDGLRGLSRIRLGRRWLQRLADSVHALGGARRAVLWALVLTLPVALINIAVVTLVLQAFGVSLPFSDVMALAPAADAVIALPLTINGIGLRESAFEILLQPLNVAGEIAVAVALTRWVGELQRAGVGGVLFLIGDRLLSVNPRKTEVE